MYFTISWINGTIAVGRAVTGLPLPRPWRAARIGPFRYTRLHSEQKPATLTSRRVGI
jgi:hypothetical protein